MTPKRRGRWLLVGGIMTAAVACRPSADRRSPVDFDRMRQQRRYDAYEASRFFPDGAAMQPPPPHTVSRNLAGGGLMMSPDAALARSGGRPVRDLLLLRVMA